MQPRTRSIDGVARRPAGTPVPQLIAPRPAAPVQPRLATPHAQQQPTQPQPQTQQRQRRSFTPPAGLQPKRKHHWWRALLFPVAVIFSLMASFLVQSQPLGIAAITIYGLVAWVRKVPSRYTFIMAFMSLAAVVLLLVVRQDVTLAGNFSTYTFLLLVVGIVSVLQESKSYPKRRDSKILNLRRKKRL